MATTHLAVVGEPYVPGRTGWAEVPMFSLGPAAAVVRLFVASSVSREIAACGCHGSTSFAWVDCDKAALMCIRLGSRRNPMLPWLDIPYHASHDAHDGRDPLAWDTGPCTDMLAVLEVIDALTGIVVGIRDYVWPAKAADAIRATVAQHLSSGHHPGYEASSLHAIRARYPEGAPGVQRLVAEHAEIWTISD